MPRGLSKAPHRGEPQGGNSDVNEMLSLHDRGGPLRRSSCLKEEMLVFIPNELIFHEYRADSPAVLRQKTAVISLITLAFWMWCCLGGGVQAEGDC